MYWAGLFRIEMVEKTLEGKHKRLTDTAGRQRLRSPDIDKGMLEYDQNLTKMFEQVCAVTVGRHVHKPPSDAVGE